MNSADRTSPTHPSHRLRRRRLRAGPPRRERRTPSCRPARRAAHARPRDPHQERGSGGQVPLRRRPGAFGRSPELAFSESEDAFDSLSSDVAAASARARGATRRAGRGARRGRRRLRSRVDRRRVARPRGMALRRLGLGVERRHAARAVPGDDRPGARGGVAARAARAALRGVVGNAAVARKGALSAVLRLHLADDAERACPYLSRLDAEGCRDVIDLDPREQHADDREIPASTLAEAASMSSGSGGAPATPRRRPRR